MPWIIQLQGFFVPFHEVQVVVMVLPCCVFFGGRFSWVVWANMFLQDLLSNIVKIYQLSCDHSIRHFSPARDVFGQIRATNQLTIVRNLTILGDIHCEGSNPFFSGLFQWVGEFIDSTDEPTTTVMYEGDVIATWNIFGDSFGSIGGEDTGPGYTW